MVRRFNQLLLMLAVLGSPARAQRLPVPWVPVELGNPQARATQVGLAGGRFEPVPVIEPVLAGLALGVAGSFVGGAVGYTLGGGGEICGDDPCGLVGGAFGAVIGEIVGVGLGVHLGNARAGRLDITIAASLGALLVGSRLAGATGWEPGVLIPLVGTAQLAATVFAERRLAPSR
jgi:hypothetical protein